MRRLSSALLLPLFLLACSGEPDPTDEATDAGVEETSDAGSSPDAGASDDGGTTTDAGTKPDTIGPAGGTVTGDGVTLTIPAGALDKDVEIAIATGSASPDGYEARSKVFTFSPDGLTFQSPVSVSFEFTGDAADLAVFWSRPGDTSSFDKLGGNVEAGRITAEITHFSVGFAGVETGTSQPGDLVASRGVARALVVDEGNVYWSFVEDDGNGNAGWGIAWAPKSGGAVTAVSAGVSVMDVEVAEGKVFWIEQGSFSQFHEDGAVYSVPVTGGTPTKLTDAKRGSSLALSTATREVLFGAQTSTGGVSKVSFDGGTATQLTTEPAPSGAVTPLDIEIGSSSLMWVRSGIAAFWSAPLTGGAGKLNTFFSTPYRIAADGDTVFATANQGIKASIWTVPIGGGTPSMLHENSDGDFYEEIVVDATDVYFTSRQGIWRLARTGGTPELVVPDSAGVMSPLAADATHLYWGSPTGGIRRIAKP